MNRVFCFLLATVLLFGLTACGRKPPEPETTAPPTTEATEAPTTQATEAPATEPTEPPTEEPTQPPLVLHSGLREDGSFSGGTLFIGDSLTFQLVYGLLMPKCYIGDARYIAVAGSQITAFFDGTRVSCNAATTLASPEFDGMLFSEAAGSLGAEATAIYLMWGTNYTKDASAQDYIDILDYLLAACPNATIHLQLVPYAKDIIPYEIINQRILGACSHYQETGEQRVVLLDTFTGIGERVSSDGVHLSDPGKEKWYETILAHAELLELPE